jgi:hypothetical protein
MPEEYTNEKFWKLFESLPQELKDAIYAEESGDSIYEACKRYDVMDSLDDIVGCVSHVLVGTLPPEDFQSALEIVLKIDKETSKKIFNELNRSIFYPVKTSLDRLYHPDATTAPGPVQANTEIKPEIKSIGELSSELKKTPRKDDYRESTETIE